MEFREARTIRRYQPRRERDLGPRINERIRILEVRVVGPEGEQLGVMPTEQARGLAREQGLDLVEIAPTAQPPVCRILDYGKFKYEEARKKKQQRKAHTPDLKGVRLRPSIDEHDFQVKLRNVKRFLEAGDKVRVTVMFRRRELSHPEIGRQKLERMASEIEEYGTLETGPSMDGRIMHMVVGPKSGRRGGGSGASR